ncbi:ribulose-phosphate 3-epimerase [Vibrio parahaemolyticus]|uniref:ribulose-phosphate 3-epimerase n=1 Tax=Vibrio parahaemolyticus TaxID=670 RepID=UPI00111CB439|nr:ribulose-phosphate 3-epimerase [Vibrio parahaemolyticus]MCX4132445.1 ribulose-phosphate 3-epimerase [Vibrio parahaemolyticus]MCZ6383384.1 ribulose-phosphate 3-epimerase [Vibrio parahaemolyticus]MDF4862809.1 ribulose-phosphate 3-epimerase [Vibrio parahaemolyticus]MRE01366.1 hypothetical protein [Vibrio parahaemolyticus]TNZ02762.1 hypothetical protein CGK56_13685 [Vibrio parahaemolyticus]
MITEKNFIPSLICSDQFRLLDSIKATETSGVSRLHLDVFDNCFVKGFGFSIDTIKKMVDLTHLKLDVHIMTENTYEVVLEVIETGVDRILVHTECKDFDSICKAIINSDIKLGLALKPDTPISAISEYIAFADCLLIFAVNPGKRGQKLRPDSLIKIRSARNFLSKRNLYTEIIVDGGVYKESLSQLYKAGADYFIVGTAFYGDASSLEVIYENIESLKKCIIEM